jgi:hypothetical protein
LIFLLDFFVFLVDTKLIKIVFRSKTKHQIQYTNKIKVLNKFSKQKLISQHITTEPTKMVVKETLYGTAVLDFIAKFIYVEENSWGSDRDLCELVALKCCLAIQREVKPSFPIKKAHDIFWRLKQMSVCHPESEDLEIQGKDYWAQLKVKYGNVNPYKSGDARIEPARLAAFQSLGIEDQYAPVIIQQRATNKKRKRVPAQAPAPEPKKQVIDHLVEEQEDFNDMFGDVAEFNVDTASVVDEQEQPQSPIRQEVEGMIENEDVEDTQSVATAGSICLDNFDNIDNNLDFNFEDVEINFINNTLTDPVTCF